MLLELVLQQPPLQHPPPPPQANPTGTTPSTTTTTARRTQGYTLLGRTPGGAIRGGDDFPKNPPSNPGGPGSPTTAILPPSVNLPFSVVVAVEEVVMVDPEEDGRMALQGQAHCTPPADATPEGVVG